MSKIYVNSSKSIKTAQKTKKDEERRKRPVIMNFRVTPQEKLLIDIRIRLSGLSRQDFYIQSMLKQQIVTYGNVRTFSEIKLEVEYIGWKLEKMADALPFNSKDVEVIRMIINMINGLKGGYSEEILAEVSD